MFTFLDMRAMLVSEAVSAPMFVLGGVRGSTATSDLVLENAKRTFLVRRLRALATAVLV